MRFKNNVLFKEKCLQISNIKYPKYNNLINNPLSYSQTRVKNSLSSDMVSFKSKEYDLKKIMESVKERYIDDYGIDRHYQTKLCEERKLFEPIAERGKKQFSPRDIWELGCLSDEEFKYAKQFFYIPQRKDEQFSGKEIAYLFKGAEYKHPNLEIIRTLTSYTALDTFTIRKIAEECNPIEIERLDKRGYLSEDFQALNFNWNPDKHYFYIKTSKLNDEEFSFYKELEKRKDISADGKLFFAAIGKKDFQMAEKEFNIQRKKVLLNPKLYISGDTFFIAAYLLMRSFLKGKNKENLIKLIYAFNDNDSFNNFLRLRDENVQEYLNKISSFTNEDLKRLSLLCRTKDKNGKPHNWHQKVEFINIIKYYKDIKSDFIDFDKKIESGTIDIEELNLNLFKSILKTCGLSEKEIEKIPKEKLMGWNIKYLSTLKTHECVDDEFSDMGALIKYANKSGQFIKNIPEESIYGYANSDTADQFKKFNMNSEKWIHPDSKNNVEFKTVDKNHEILEQFAKQTEEDIEVLRQTKAKDFIDKQFKDLIKDDKFIIPHKIKTKKTELIKLLNTAMNKLSQLFQRAYINLKSKDELKTETAKKVLTIKSHLQQRLKDIEELPQKAKSRELDLTIKMWDRNPQHDLFQGCYSTCCIAPDGGNGRAMPIYLLNTAFNMIEIIDKKTGNTIGNSLCFWGLDKDNVPSLILDNIEINNSFNLSKKQGINLRNAIVQFASNTAKSITGKKDNPIYLGTKFNDLPCSDLKSKKREIKFIGDIAVAQRLMSDENEVYLDIYDGWTDIEDMPKSCNLYKLK